MGAPTTDGSAQGPQAMAISERGTSSVERRIYQE
jgi:hypothetical protein